MQKKILIFSTAYLPLVGGAELAIKEITERIPEYDFFMITTRFSRAHPRHERIGNIEIYRVGTGILSFFDKLLSPFLGACLARKIMKRHSVDFFWSMMVSFTSMSPFLLKICGLHKKIPILLTLQEGDSEAHLTYRYGGLIFIMWKLAIRYADSIQVISNYLRKLALKRGARVPIEIVPNGVAIEHFSKAISDEKRSELKSKLGKNTGDVFLVTTSRLVLKNAIDDVIKSLQYLPGHIKFVILGKGPDGEKLKILAKALKVENRTLFLGEISHEDMPAYLHISDIYIRPSLSEGLGSSFLEAMAAGLPVIATPVGGIPDFLIDRKTGLFCRVRDPRSIAVKVRELLQNDGLRNTISETAKKTVEEHYNWNTNIVRKMKIIFNTIAK
ncbi:MAG: glycosyltransferase family 4 protein [Candidatus Niyogibacteria bacterium]|nr:glycosyltransferase family 4 protein [Candidatus Niyogibacteria bacterium]